MKKLRFSHADACLAANLPDLAQLKKMTARFAPTEMRVDLSKLSPGDRQALVKLIRSLAHPERYLSQSIVERQSGPATPSFGATQRRSAKRALRLFLDQ